MPARIIDVLHKSGYVDSQMHDILSRMRSLRSMAVHGHQSAGPVTADIAREFFALASDVLEILKFLRKGTED